ncbi:MAG: lamin tail domain-containing protein [Saprospiraceae bacterium]
MARNYTLCLTFLISLLAFGHQVSAQTANAGPDQLRCSLNTATMAANKPTANNKGKWTYVSGVTGSFAVNNDSLSNVLFTAGTTTPNGSTTLRWTIEPGLVISQVYAAGNNAGASFRNDFVELHNRSSQSINLTGYSLQYAAAAGNFSSQANLSGTIAPGRFFLVSLAGGTTNGVALPTADLSNTAINMADAGGKIVLFKTTTLQSSCGTAACSAAIKSLKVDQLAWGTATGELEGTVTSALGLTASAKRNPVGSACTDTDNNFADFTVGTILFADIKNSASAAVACGGSTSDDMVITWTPNPLNTNSVTENSGTANDGTITCGASATIQALATPATYLWTTGASTASISVSPTISTSYTCTVSNAGCSVTTLRNITVSAITVTTTVAETSGTTVNDGNICNGSMATITALPAGASYLWSGGLGTTQSIIVSPISTTNYTCTVTTSPGCSNSTTRTITVNTPAAIINVSETSAGVNNDGKICQGANATLTASGGSTYLWSTGAITNSISVSPSPPSSTFVVTATNSSGCTVTATRDITVQAAPVPNITVTETSGIPDNNTVCFGDSGTLTVSGANTYAWSPAGSLNQATGPVVIATPTVTTTYTVTATDASSCSATTTAQLIVDNPASGITITETSGLANNDGTICDGASVTLDAKSGQTSYTWVSAPAGFNSSVASITVSPTVTTFYNLTVTNSTTGCVGQTSTIITVVDYPSVAIGVSESSGLPDDAIICEGTTAVVAVPNTANTSYSWSSSPSGMYPATSSITVSPTVTTTYSLTASTAGCVASATQLVDVLPRPDASITVTETSALAADDRIICRGDFANLEVPGGNGTYTWLSSTGALFTTSAINVAPTVTTTYSVTITGINGCTANSSATITVTDPPSTATTVTETSGTPNDGQICLGASATISIPNVANTTYSWVGTPGTFTSALASFSQSPTVTTTYTVTATRNGCSSVGLVLLVVNPFPSASITVTETSGLANNDSRICVGSNAQLSVPAGASYSWTSTPAGFTSALSTITVSPTVNTTYNLTVTGAGGCSTIASASSITVTATPTLTLALAENSGTANDGDVCMSVNTQFTATSALSNTFTWSSVPAGIYPGLAVINVTPTVTTTYTITASISATGCAATAQSTLTVFQALALCKPLSIKMNTPTANITLADVNNGSLGASISIDKNSFSCLNIGVNPVIITATNAFCTSNCTANVTIIDGPGCSPALNSGAPDQPSIVDPCVCKGTPTNLTDGQFSDKVDVLNAYTNEIWVVKNVTGLYKLATPLGQDPLNPVLVGDQLTEVVLGGGRSNFELTGFHIDSIGYSIEVWRLDPNNVGIPGSELSTGNRCYYPTPVFSPRLPTVMPTSAPAITLNPIDVNAASNTGGTVTSSGTGVVGNVFTPSSVMPGTYLLSSTLSYGNPTIARTGQDIKNPVCASTIRQNVTVNNNLPALNCRNSVNFSLDKACSVDILAGDFLLGVPVGFGGYEALIMNGNNVITKITAADVNKTYTVKVSDLSNPRNSCWSSIRIEDKTAPLIDCTGQKVFYCEDDVKLNLSGIPALATPATVGVFTLPVVTECSAYTLTFFDQGVQGACSDSYIFKGARNYTAIDQYGNVSTCAVPFEIKRRYLIDILPPADITLSCSSVSGNTVDTVLSKQPKILGRNLNQYKGCKLGATYTDAYTPNACGIGFTIKREWVMTSDCESQPRIHNQLISVKDFTAPQIVSMIPDVSIFVETNTPDCKASGIALPLPVVKDNCDGNPSIIVQITKGSTTHGSGTIIWNLLPDTYFLSYSVTDKCGNATNFTKILVVQDKNAPVAACQTNVEVSLTRSDLGVINAQSLDAGSKDNCCLDVNRFEIRRMSETDADFKPTMNVRCSDREFLAILRVWDCNGNSNTCMTNVLVADKLPPLAVTENISVECGNDALAKVWLDAHPLKPLSIQPSVSNPGYFDHATSDPTCTVDAKVTKVIDSLDQCGNGFYAYDWTVTDQSGNSVVVQQRYTSRNVSLFSATFPKDTTVILNGQCDSVGTSIKVTGTAKIDVLNGSCPLPTLSYFDQASKISDDSVCFRIVRVWRVSNLCRPLPAEPTIVGHVNGKDITVTSSETNGGYFEYSQNINVIDLTPPEIISATAPTFAAVGKECKVQVSFVPMVVKDCSGQRTKQTFSLYKENGVQVATSSNDLPGSVEISKADFGKYKVVYKVVDECGNANYLSQNFIAKDVLKPTPVCHDNVAVEISPTGVVMVQAKVIDAGSYDNCSSASTLKFRIRVISDSTLIKLDTVAVNPDTLPGMYTFICPPKGSSAGTSTTWKVQLWVGDEAGNWDFCETVVQVQDNFAMCNYDPNEMRPLEVQVQTEKGKDVEGVAVQLVGTKTMNILSNKVGKVKFNDLPIYGSYVLTPNKNDVPLNGVSTFDLVMISKHILGVQPLTTPYQYIAADVNRSSSISVADVVELRKMILAVQNGFSKNTSWRFVDKSYQFPQNTNPWSQAFPEKIAVNGLLGAPAPGFVAVKVGDVNVSASTQRLVNTTQFQCEERNYQSGEIFTVNFHADDILDGYQFTFEYDKNSLELIDIVDGKDGFALLENGIIMASQLLTDSKDAAKFGFVFRAKNSAKLSEAVHINSRMLSAEAYDKTGNINKVVLSFNNGASAKFELFQNQPNPFNGSTSIGFVLPEQGSARLVISDVAGKVLKTITGDYSKGYHQINIDRTELGSAGILYYTLETAAQTATRKMIILD